MLKYYEGVWQGRRKFDLFAERSEMIHGAQRRLVNNIYSMSSLKDFEHGVDAVVERLMQCLHRQGPDATVDMGKWVQLFAFGKFSQRSSINVTSF